MSPRKKKEGEVKEISIFDFLNDICSEKKGNLLTDSTQSKFNSFMILRYLSMDNNLTALANFVNSYQGVLSKEQFYKLLLVLIPKKSRFLKYIGSKKDTLSKVEKEFVEKLTVLLKVSSQEATEYLSFLSEVQVQTFLDKFGGMVRD